MPDAATVAATGSWVGGSERLRHSAKTVLASYY
uniref:Uncharacterized protein n=1 Tax=Arundo donax TaxID=35708 RepID=A0A0A9HEP5_ARUDO